MSEFTSFSKSNRNLILTVDLVIALASTLQAEGAIPQKTKACIRRINNRIKTIQDIIYGGARLVLDPTGYRKYERIINSIKQLM